MVTTLRGIGSALILAVVLVACSSPTATSPVSEQEARMMAEKMLTAYNDGDYAAWSADWSQTMKNAIDEAAFAAFREQMMASAGRYEEIESADSRPGNNRGVWRWEFTTRFAGGSYEFMIAFAEGSALIEGVNLQPS